jgi:hypothetical protein
MSHIGRVMCFAIMKNYMHENVPSLTRELREAGNVQIGALKSTSCAACVC